MYAVKNTFEKPNADVLLELKLGPADTANQIFADPRVTVEYFRSEDRSYAEAYFIWESKEKYDEWNTEHSEQHLQTQQENEIYMDQMEIIFHRIYPPHDDYDWTPLRDPRITEESKITYNQVFE